MRTSSFSFAALSFVSLGLAACGTPSHTCTVSITISPTTATLDHTISGNSQAYVQNVEVPSGCPLPPLPAPRWTLSNTTAASISMTGVASCRSAAASPITVNSGSAATAILICK